jgi:hypothetical protein
MTIKVAYLLQFSFQFVKRRSNDGHLVVEMSLAYELVMSLASLLCLKSVNKKMRGIFISQGLI